MMATATTPTPTPRPRRHHRSSTGSSFDAGSSHAFAPLAVPRRASTTTTPTRVRRAAFQVGGSSEEDDDDCPLVREVNQRARQATLDDDHFGDFSYDAEAHKAQSQTSAIAFPATSPEKTPQALPPLTIPSSVARCASSPTLTNAPNATHVPSSASSTNSFNSGASTPIYLKNGRPLKPSLKSRVNLSLSTSDIAAMRAHAKSAPTTPRVHFPTRERLESVVLFDKRARPLEVASGDSPLASPRFFDEDDERGIPSFRIRPQSSFPFPNMSPRASTTNLQGFSAALMAKTKLKIALSRSAPLQPVPHPDAHVHLAAMRLLATRLSGSVLVKNISFNKRVSVRYTFDNWETTSEVAGAWSSPNALADLPQGELKPFGEEESELDVARGIMVPVPTGWDRFTFNIKLDDVAPYLSARSMLIAVKFEAASVGEWWDNCGGRNYRFEFDHVPRKEKEKEVKKDDPTPTMTTPKPIGRPRSNTSPAPLNSDATVADPASASLLSAKLNEVASQERPTLKLQLPANEPIKSDDASTPTPKVAHKPLTPPDSTSSSPREPPAELPTPMPKPQPTLPSPEDSPSSGRRESNPLPSPSAIEAPAHSTTNVKDQSYADFLAKYCFAGAPPTAPSCPAPPAQYPSSFGANTNSSFGAYTPTSSFGQSSYPTPASAHTSFGWGSSSGTPRSSVGFNYGTSFSGADL
ncbi:phosphatase regulatory subunit domain protein, putative [Rhizoctonia solani AG-3 Rhs1AP]|uniref:Phosphatase regulatory subunit domain protein, putative n=2 Tax=Rhizoctonia solani AG-3 TaxID=1086053 RepID=X8J309_9AGAM|nr:phosphatase regulatory subunit domain protein, putative [Rhizoctonia solani AG-3 Rhs1AP]KEP52582.1 putative phosphatase regulatory subunit domain protein [Rhizoctonia solani 123E]